MLELRGSELRFLGVDVLELQESACSMVPSLLRRVPPRERPLWEMYRARSFLPVLRHVNGRCGSAVAFVHVHRVPQVCFDLRGVRSAQP